MTDEEILKKAREWAQENLQPSMTFFYKVWSHPNDKNKSLVAGFEFPHDDKWDSCVVIHEIIPGECEIICKNDDSVLVGVNAVLSKSEGTPEQDGEIFLEDAVYEIRFWDNGDVKIETAY